MERVIAEAGIPLLTFEHRQNIGVPPSLATKVAHPVVVVAGLTAHIDHAIDGRSPAKHSALRHDKSAVFEGRVRLGGLGFNILALDRLEEGRWDVNPRITVLPPTLDQSDGGLGILREPGRQNTARSTAANDDKIEVEGLHGVAISNQRSKLSCSANQRSNSASSPSIWISPG